MVNVKNIADEADMIINERYEIDELADAAGGYFAMPSADELAYTELLFDVCDQFGIHYYSADKKARAFVEEVTRVTWAKQQEEKTGVQQSIRPAFTAYKRICICQPEGIYFRLVSSRGVLKGVSLCNVSM